MGRLIRTFAVMVCALILSGCATMGVGSYAGRGVDFARYRTWDWGPRDALPTGDARFDNNEIFQDHFQGAVEKQLATRFERVTQGTTPDLWLHYHASIDRRIMVDEVERQSDGHCPGYDCQPRVTEYEAGTFVLDVVDARTNKLVWRGWAEDIVTGVIESQDRMERQITEAVTRMMRRFPTVKATAPGGREATGLAAP